jgi:hypothetical protein
MSDISSEPQRRVVPWLLALGLLLLAIWGVAKAMDRHPATAAHPATTSVHSQSDESPSPLRQYAAADAVATPAMPSAA